MSIRSSALTGVLALIALLVATTAPARGQAQAKAAPQWSPARTPDGQPDIQGTWNSIDSFFTPLQRPAKVAGKEQISKEELKAVLEEEADRKLEGADRGVGAYGHEWYEFNRNVERFTRVDRDTLKYQITIDDPKVYTAPWTIAFPFKRDKE
jgi:hypothetical protein